MPRKKMFFLSLLFLLIIFSAWIIVQHIEDKRQLRNKYGQSWNFLQKNMAIHSSNSYELIDFKGNSVKFYPYNYTSLYKAKNAFDSLSENLALVQIHQNDEENISDVFLKEHIEKSIKLWKDSKFTKTVSFKDYANYILPYRAGEEEFIEYNDSILHKFAKAFDSIKSVKKPLQAVQILNNKLKENLIFDLRSHADLKRPSIIDVLKSRKGSCKSLTETTAQVMRMASLAVAIDECPVWGHRNSGHQWNAFLDENGKWIPFGGAETNPDEFKKIHDSVKAPKIYRHTYAVQENFSPPIANAQNIPIIFRKNNKIDVTKEYVETSNVTINVKERKGIYNSLLYLAVFNAEEWKIVSWSQINNGKAEFRNMGNNNVVYLPVYYHNGKTTPATSPFLLTPTGKKNIEPDLTKKQSLTMAKYNKFYDLKWNIGIPKKNWKMELFYWDSKWVSLGICKVGNDLKLHYKNVPSNALFLIKSLDWDNTWQRIFTIEENNPVWF